MTACGNTDEANSRTGVPVGTLRWDPSGSVIVTWDKDAYLRRAEVKGQRAKVWSEFSRVIFPSRPTVVGAKRPPNL
jgi:hypothetical protein